MAYTNMFGKGHNHRKANKQTDWQIITDGQNLTKTLVDLKDSASNCMES